jgi:tRNA dimethylallyltransferase
MAGVANILAVLGPTASGKSALAMEVARGLGAEILSLDSMQVYRGMDIGTAKPTVAEREAVRHHLIDLVEPAESFTVARFVEMANAVIADARRRGVPLIAVGGTPLYYKALFHGLFDGPAADAGLRERLQQESNHSLHQRLTVVDPAAAGRIHVNDTRRLVRALEVYQLSGRPISSLQVEWDSPAPLHAAVWVGLQWDRDMLNRRINARVRQMIADGWLDETAGLLGRFGSLSPTAAEATGYAELIAHLSGRMSLEDAVEQIKIATRQLARRQMKWFRRFRGVHWLAGDRPLGELAAAVIELWQARSFAGGAAAD